MVRSRASWRTQKNRQPLKSEVREALKSLDSGFHRIGAERLLKEVPKISFALRGFDQGPSGSLRALRQTIISVNPVEDYVDSQDSYVWQAYKVQPYGFCPSVRSGGRAACKQVLHGEFPGLCAHYGRNGCGQVRGHGVQPLRRLSL